MPAVTRPPPLDPLLGRRWRRWATPVALALVAGACSGAGDATDTVQAAPPPTEPVEEVAWPVPDWSEVSADDAGLDADALDAMAAAAEAGGSQCLVVTRDGELVAEWYWQGFEPDQNREIFSASKSVTSTLVGIAQDRGLLDIEQPASDFIEEWKGTPSEDVTIRNLISNDSGRFQDGPTDYTEMAGKAEDKTAFSIALSQQHDPGTQWVYNNAAIQTLEAVLEEATGMPVGEFAEEALFEPIGMESEINTDAAGNALTFMGVQSSCRDLARFGLLFEREGEWDGEEVVSPAFVQEATSPSQELNRDYGFLWWLSSSDVATGDAVEAEDPMAGAGTEDMYAALGLQNQVVAVFPEWDVVVTRLGGAAGADGAPGFGYGDIILGTTEAMGEGAETDEAPADEAPADEAPQDTAPGE